MRTLIATAVCLAILVTVGCKPAEEAGHAIVDCAKADQSKLEALIVELTPMLVGSSPDWSGIEQQALAAGESIGGCALAELVNAYLAPKAGRGAPPIDSGRAARAALEDFRAKHAGGAAFRTEQGDL